MASGRERSGSFDSLLARAAAGDNPAYDEVISRASARLLKLTRRMFHAYPRLRRFEQTEDVYQQAALRLYRSLADVKPDSLRSFMGLAATQINRTLIDLARHHFGPEGAAAHHHSDPGPDGAPGIVARAEAIDGRPESLEEWARLHEVIETLPAEEREIFSLTWYVGLGRAEIADLLDVSLSTVKRRWRSARLLIHRGMRGVPPSSE